MSLAHRLYWVTDTLRETRWLRRSLAIGAADTVLDVGSGGSPNLRSNVLCDKFPWDGTERHHQAIALDRPFVLGDVEALPFADNAFDFVICSHVLEHVERPERAVAELQRVAPRGYIETPAAPWERLAGFPFHRWMVASDHGGLRFTAKRGAVNDPELTAWFAEMQASLGLGGYIWWRRRAAGVYTSLLWSGEIPVVVEREGAPAPDTFSAAELHSSVGELQERVPSGRVARLLETYGRYIRRGSTPVDLASRLRCPLCRGTLASGVGAEHCINCGHEYARDGAPFPVLLAPIDDPDRPR